MRKYVKIVLEIPFRGISLEKDNAGELAMLALTAEKTVADPKGIIAEALFLVKQEKHDMFIRAINEYRSLGKISWNENSGVVTMLENNVVRVASREGIMNVISEWRAESHVVLMIERENLIGRLNSIFPEPRWWQLRKYICEEKRYVVIAESDKKVGFVFMDHGTLELLGTTEEILRCFDVLRTGML